MTVPAVVRKDPTLKRMVTSYYTPAMSTLLPDSTDAKIVTIRSGGRDEPEKET